MVFIAPALPLPPVKPAPEGDHEFDEPRDAYVDWGKWNRHYWLDHYEDFLEFFFSQCFTEPHSTKPREDCVGWGLETDPETLVATQLAPRLQDEEGVRELLSRIDCPVLVIHGRDDGVRPWGPVHGSRSSPAASSGPRGVRPLPACPRPGQGQPAPAGLRQARPAAAALGPRQVPSQACALHLLPDRPRACPAGRRDRGRAAQAASRPRDRLARPAPGDQGAAGSR